MSLHLIKYNTKYIKMKNPYIFKPALLLGIFAVFGFGVLQAQSKKEKKASEEKEIGTSIKAQNYVFKAQTLLPMRGPTRHLNGDYDLSVSENKIVSFLPYMGRIYTAPIDPANGPLRFTSTDFAYAVQTKKKGGWDISIKPKDVRSVREFNLHVSDNGYATLQVSGNDRQPVTFYGYVVEKS